MASRQWDGFYGRIYNQMSKTCLEVRDHKLVGWAQSNDWNPNQLWLFRYCYHDPVRYYTIWNPATQYTFCYKEGGTLAQHIFWDPKTEPLSRTLWYVWTERENGLDAGSPRDTKFKLVPARQSESGQSLGGYCLDLAAGKSDNGTAVWTHRQHGGPNQWWGVVPASKTMGPGDFAITIAGSEILLKSELRCMIRHSNSTTKTWMQGTENGILAGVTESNQFAYVKEPFKGKIWRLCTRREDPQLTKGPETYLLVHEETRMCLYRPRYLDKDPRLAVGTPNEYKELGVGNWFWKFDKPLTIGAEVNISSSYLYPSNVSQENNSQTQSGWSIRVPQPQSKGPTLTSLWVLEAPRG